MALCSVELFEDVTHKSASIKLNVFTKKNIGNICVKAVYIRTWMNDRVIFKFDDLFDNSMKLHLSIL